MDLFFRSATPGVVWPALPSAMGGQLLALQYQLEASQWWPGERLREEQLRQLRLLAAHAFENVPYYRAGFETAGYEAGTGLNWESFARLPVLPRRDLQLRRNDLVSRKASHQHGTLLERHSSGSTGTPVHFLGNQLSYLFDSALVLRDHLWHGRDLMAKCAVIRTNVEDGERAGWGTEVESAFWTGRTATLNIRAPIEVQARWLARQSPAYLMTHPSNLKALAAHCIANGVRLRRLKATGTFGETLPSDLRALVREAWAVPLVDIYSAEEAGRIASQCPAHEHYHVHEENLIVEVLDQDGTVCAPGRTGRVVITTLHNFDMPLIRYEIGDYAVRGGACPCGRGLGTLERIAGRSRNLVTLPDGSRHWPSFPSKLWLEVAPILQFRFIQKTLHDIDATFVAERALTVGEKDRLARLLQERLGHPFNIRVQQVGEIARVANAKYEDFTSELPQ